MAFLLNKTTIASYLRSHAQKTEDPVHLSRRGFHIEPGTREKALLAEDSALKPFKSYKKSVKKLKRVGDVLTIVVVAGMWSFIPGFDERSEGLWIVICEKQLNDVLFTSTVYMHISIIFLISLMKNETMSDALLSLKA